MLMTNSSFIITQSILIIYILLGHLSSRFQVTKELWLYYFMIELSCVYGWSSLSILIMYFCSLFPLTIRLKRDFLLFSKNDHLGFPYPFSFFLVFVSVSLILAFILLSPSSWFTSLFFNLLRLAKKLFCTWTKNVSTRFERR